jgi:C_GCAxxG_C_C family probable redox protein
MNLVEDAVSNMKNGLCCSQSILCAYGPSFGLDHEMAVRLASGFCGGMGRMASTCGAVTGAYMILGMKADAATAADREGRGRVCATVREFARRFTARNGSICCKDLMGCDISTAEGLAFADEKGLFPTICPSPDYSWMPPVLRPPCRLNFVWPTA